VAALAGGDDGHLGAIRFNQQRRIWGSRLKDQPRPDRADARGSCAPVQARFSLAISTLGINVCSMMIKRALMLYHGTLLHVDWGE
jgi:hypothetical protein